MSDITAGMEEVFFGCGCLLVGGGIVFGAVAVILVVWIIGG